MREGYRKMRRSRTRAQREYHIKRGVQRYKRWKNGR
ncbi:MAG: hypothetical protein [Microvirus sp.]|nr:MAG: hypothetical protein [Microvirus sp.]